jgi:hypothetical protein
MLLTPWGSDAYRESEPKMRINGSSEMATEASGPPYLSPKELKERGRCSRSSVDRIARRAGLTRLCLGEGRNGIVRYSRREVEAFETKRQA